MGIEPVTTVSKFARYAAPAVVGGLVLVACLLVADSYRTKAHADPAASAPNTFTQGSIDGVPLTLEVATSLAAQNLGLGGRTSVPDDYGMLFVFPVAADYGFWMKDMEAPIDILWLDDQGQVTTIKQDVATSTYPTVFYPSGDATYVLETRAGFAAEHKVKVGDTLSGLPIQNTISQ
jgi:uncharacterized membrane protein (UPF0127 family)